MQLIALAVTLLVTFKCIFTISAAFITVLALCNQIALSHSALYIANNVYTHTNVMINTKYYMICHRNKLNLKYLIKMYRKIPK